jgi:integrase
MASRADAKRVVLTDKLVKSCKPPKVAGERKVIYDALVPGFALRVTDKGHKSYVLAARYPANPKSPTRRALGDADVASLAKAREEALRWIALIKRKVDPRDDEIRQATEQRAKAAEEETRLAEEQARATTFASVADRYLKEYVERNTKPATIRETRRIIERDVKPRWGERPIREIGKQDVNELLDAIANKRDRARRGTKDGAPVQSNRTLARLKTLFRWAVDMDLIEADPTAGVRRRVKETARDRALSDDEIRWFWAGCDSAGWPFGPLFKLLLLTAQRRDEVGTMEWPDIDLEKRLWTIPREKAKNDRAHEVPLSALAVEIIEALPRTGRLVFSTNGARPVSGFSRAKTALDRRMGVLRHAEQDSDAQAAPIADWILHDLRRTAATGMARLNIAPHVVDKILNHVSGTIRGVAAIYNRYGYGDERKAALAAWGRYVESTVRPAPANVVPLRTAG